MFMLTCQIHSLNQGLKFVMCSVFGTRYIYIIIGGKVPSCVQGLPVADSTACPFAVAALSIFSKNC